MVQCRQPLAGLGLFARLFGPGFAGRTAPSFFTAGRCVRCRSRGAFAGVLEPAGLTVAPRLAGAAAAAAGGAEFAGFAMMGATERVGAGFTTGVLGGPCGKVVLFGAFGLGAAKSGAVPGANAGARPAAGGEPAAAASCSLGAGLTICRSPFSLVRTVCA